MNILRKVTGILLALFVITVPLWLSTDMATEVFSSRNGRLPAGNSINKSPISQESPTVTTPVYPTSSPAVRDLPPYKQVFVLDREINPRLTYGNNPTAYSKYAVSVDPLLAVQANALAPAADGFSTPLLNYNGQGYTYISPPDTVGDIGLTHYIQAINDGGGTRVQIYNKNGTTAVPAFSLDSLGSGNCADGYGDPIILYDRLADRWMLSEFSRHGNQLCIYISKTDDPAGSYHAYAFNATNSFPDYPKYGVWPDAYYIGTNEGTFESLPTLYALDRASMLTGAAATSQSFTASSLSGFGFQNIIPSDLDGATPPPVNAPNYFMRHRDTENHGQGNCPVHAGGDCLELFEFTVDWTNPANSGINGPIPIQITEFDSDLCGLESFYCFPQPNSATTLDPLREVIMNRLQYRNFGTHETLVGNFVTDIDGTDHGGIRWFELRKSGAGAWSLHQEGTYGPDASHRWMGAISMDGNGNIALAYNVTDATVTYPSLRYVGRMNSDSAGTMPQGEYTIIDGTSPNSSFRYGDYSAMGVDPADDCTFWFTGMYNVSSQWSTRIASFKFDGCTNSPIISVDPVTVHSLQAANTEATKVLTINNTGDADLAWSLSEDSTSTCNSANDISWITSAAPNSGTIGASTADDVNVTFNSTGLALGVYTASLCIDSNDAITPQLIVPVTMTVAILRYTYLPIILK